MVENRSCRVVYSHHSHLRAIETNIFNVLVLAEIMIFHDLAPLFEAVIFAICDGAFESIVFREPNLRFLKLHKFFRSPNIKARSSLNNVAFTQGLNQLIFGIISIQAIALWYAVTCENIFKKIKLTFRILTKLRTQTFSKSNFLTQLSCTSQRLPCRVFRYVIVFIYNIQGGPF